MSRNPFVPTASQETEFSFGPGRFANPQIDFQSPRIDDRTVAHIADPDRTQQILDLAAMKRTDLNNPTVEDLPAFQGTGGAQHPDYYTTGNTERYGANPPLVRERRWPKAKWVYRVIPSRMERKW
jgi:hypothetical protein